MGKSKLVYIWLVSSMEKPLWISLQEALLCGAAIHDVA